MKEFKKERTIHMQQLEGLEAFTSLPEYEKRLIRQMCSNSFTSGYLAGITNSRG